MALDITNLYNVSSKAIQHAINENTVGVEEKKDTDTAFSTFFNTAVNNIHETNSYLSDAENEELKFSLGITENPHDLSIALQKASTALQYTVAVRDKLLDAYKEIMNMNI